MSDHLPPPSWHDLRKQMRCAHRPVAFKQAGVWALDALEEALGEDWPGRAYGHRAPPALPLHMAAHHVDAFVEVLEFALWLTHLDDVPGHADVRRDLVQDPRPARILHTLIQLETACCAQRRGWTVELEASPLAPDKPCDLVLRADRRSMAIEAKALLPSDGTTRHDEAVRAALDRFASVTSARGLSVSGKLHTAPSPSELTDLIAHLEIAASSLDEGESAPVRIGETDLLLMPFAAAARSRAVLTGPASGEDLLRRLHFALIDKAEQAMASGAGWLRVDVMTGLWPQTRWGRLPLPVKLATLSTELRHTLASLAPHVHGFVLCSKPGRADVKTEQVTCDGGLIALRQQVAPHRGRECLIFPSTPEGQADADAWTDVLDARRSWFDEALADALLPKAGDLLAAS